MKDKRQRYPCIKHVWVSVEYIDSKQNIKFDALANQLKAKIPTFLSMSSFSYKSSSFLTFSKCSRTAFCHSSTGGAKPSAIKHEASSNFISNQLAHIARFPNSADDHKIDADSCSAKENKSSFTFVPVSNLNFQFAWLSQTTNWPWCWNSFLKALYVAESSRARELYNADSNNYMDFEFTWIPYSAMTLRNIQLGLLLGANFFSNKQSELLGLCMYWNFRSILRFIHNMNWCIGLQNSFGSLIDSCSNVRTQESCGRSADTLYYRCKEC